MLGVDWPGKVWRGMAGSFVCPICQVTVEYRNSYSEVDGIRYCWDCGEAIQLEEFRQGEIEFEEVRNDH